MRHAEREIADIIRDAARKDWRRKALNAVSAAIISVTSITAWEASQLLLGALISQAGQALAHPPDQESRSGGGGKPGSKV